eukprot:scaffold3187_cov61-Phaeocystis_antarctica.AAC.3
MLCSLTLREDVARREGRQAFAGAVGQQPGLAALVAEVVVKDVEREIDPAGWARGVRGDQVERHTARRGAAIDLGLADALTQRREAPVGERRPRIDQTLHDDRPVEGRQRLGVATGSSRIAGTARRRRGAQPFELRGPLLNYALVGRVGTGGGCDGSSSAEGRSPHAVGRLHEENAKGG